MIYLIRVYGLLHHATQDAELHYSYASDLVAAGHEVTMEVRS